MGMVRKTKILGWQLFGTLFAVGIFLMFSGAPAHADAPLVIEVLERSDCTHCQEERAFLSDLRSRRSDVSVTFYDIDHEGKELFDLVTEAEKLPKATPVTIVGGTILQGFGTAETTGRRIEALLDASQGKDQVTFKQYLASGKDHRAGAEQIAGASCADGTICALPAPEPYFVTIPFVGKTVDVSAFSLPTLSVVLGFVDGFNPCAMWVLGSAAVYAAVDADVISLLLAPFDAEAATSGGDNSNDITSSAAFCSNCKRAPAMVKPCSYSSSRILRTNCTSCNW